MAWCHTAPGHQLSHCCAHQTRHSIDAGRWLVSWSWARKIQIINGKVNCCRYYFTVCASCILCILWTITLNKTIWIWIWNIIRCHRNMCSPILDHHGHCKDFLCWCMCHQILNQSLKPLKFWPRKKFCYAFFDCLCIFFCLSDCSCLAFSSAKLRTIWVWMGTKKSWCTKTTYHLRSK